MSFYVLARNRGESYSINMIMNEDEARRYGYPGEMVSVSALCVWTSPESLEDFRMELNKLQEDPSTPFSELLRDMQEGKVDVVVLDSVGIRGRLRRLLPDTPFVLINPGPEQELHKVEEFLALVGVNPLDREGIVEPDKNPKIIGPPMPEHKAADIKQAVGKTIASVEYGMVEGLPGWVHEGEAIVLHFTDGTALSIEIGSNAKNLSVEHEGLNPEDIRVDLMPMWRDQDPSHE